MRSLISKLRFDRLRQSLFGDASRVETDPGTSKVVEIQEAVAVVESMICDALSYYSRTPETAAGREGGDGSFPALNAFQRPLESLEAKSVAGALAAASGVGLTGLRSAVFVSGDELSEGFAQLQSLANRHIPLVVHPAFREGTGVGSSHSNYHGCSDLGLFQIMPHSVQQAIDFTLLAHWLAEKSLIPGIVGLDRHIVEKAFLPSAQFVQKWLGHPDEKASSPTAAQLLLFGSERLPIPRWYDLDRPVSFSSLMGSNDGASASVGRKAFFWKHLFELASQGMRELSELTGRPLSFLSEYRMEDAQVVFVTQGLAFQTARVATELLRHKEGIKAGVLGVTWLRPFPSRAVADVLARRKKAIVLECSDAPLAENAPLLRELRNSFTGHPEMWVSATFGASGQPLHAGELVELARKVRTKPNKLYWLGIATGHDHLGEFPKREGMVRAVSSDYPELAERVLGTAATLERIDQDAKTVQWIGSAQMDASEVMERLAGACSAVAGDSVLGFGWSPEPGVLSVRVTATKQGVAQAERGTPVDVLLLGKLGLDLIYNPLADLTEKSSVVIESDRAPEELWALIPEFWRSEVRRLQLRLFEIDSGFDQLLAAVSALLTGAVDLPFQEIDWKSLQDPPVDSQEVPELIRRVKQTSSDYYNLPRFWGEVMQPKRGGVGDNFPDPLVTCGAVPPYTAALARPRGTALPNIPVLDSARCTACGRCWPVCPDSAIGATLTGIQAALDAAAAIAGAEGKIAGAVKRAHRPLAAKVASMTGANGKSGVISKSTLMEAFKGVVDKMPVPDGEREEYIRTFEATADEFSRLKPVASERFFSRPEGKQKGDGKILFLAFNPNACQGCQLCIQTCPEDALHAEPRAGKARLEAAQGWGLWEQLPDTEGTIIEAARDSFDWGGVSAELLSKHCSQVQAVGSFGEPGSGERLAVRLVTAIVESKLQKSLAGHSESARKLAEDLRSRVQSQLAEGLTQADSKAVEKVLESLPRHRASLSEVTEKLSEFGKSVSVDPVKTLRLAQIAHQLEDEQWNVVEGVHGLGRSRFGVVVWSERTAEWAGRFPNHPYNAPLIVEPTPEGAQMVYGLARALASQHVDRIRLMRRAELWLESPPDLPGRMNQLEMLSWNQLSSEEKASCPPLLILTDQTAITRQGWAEVSALLSSDLPAKFVLLDSRGLDTLAVEPALFAMAHQATFISCGAISSPGRLAEGIGGAVEFPGPALIHIHVPIPSSQGFAPSKTLERAALAVQARVHPLLTYDPRKEGVFGARLSLEGNPEPESVEGEISFFDWIMGEKRFSHYLSRSGEGSESVPASDYLNLDAGERRAKVPVWSDPRSGEEWALAPELIRSAEQRRNIWRTYLEIAGLKSPFVERIRAELSEEVKQETRREFDEMKQKYETRIQEMEQNLNGRMVARLRERLLAMAGYQEDTRDRKDTE